MPGELRADQIQPASLESGRDVETLSGLPSDSTRDPSDSDAREITIEPNDAHLTGAPPRAAWRFFAPLLGHGPAPQFVPAEGLGNQAAGQSGPAAAPQSPPESTYG